MEPPHGILYKNPNTSAERAFAFYKANIPEFARVPFSQFNQNLEILRNRGNELSAMAMAEELDLHRDRQLFPRASHSARGEPVFDLSDAKELLRSDIKNGRHLGLKPSEFQRTRPQYMAFDKTIFKHRIYQEERRKKFYNYLEQKRAASRHPMRNAEFT